MAIRLKLRICTWNVGNAQPPQNLSAWLGQPADQYDIIVIGAQEANFGPEKTLSPTSVFAVEDGFRNEKDTEQPPKVHHDPQKSNTTSRLRKFSKLVKTASGAWKQHALGKLKPKTYARSASRRSSGPVIENEHVEENVSDIDVHAEENVVSLRARLHHSTGDLKGRLRRSRTAVDFDEPGCEKWRAEQCLFGNDGAVNKVDESLLMKRMQSSDRSSNGSSGRMVCFDDAVWGCDVASRTDSSSGTNTSSEREELDGCNGLCRGEQGQAEVTCDEGVNAQQQEQEQQEQQQQQQPRLRTWKSFTRPRVSSEGLREDEMESNLQGGAKKFSKAVEKSLPAGFQLVAKHHLMEIKLLIFVHERHSSRVTKTETMSEATGIGNMVGNKGGVAVKMTLEDTTFCFISSHLAAHEGAKFLQQRNEDVVEIMRNIERNRDHGLPAMHQFDHVFWLGDLNYRLDLKRVLPAAVTWSRQERWFYVINLVANKRYEELAQFDELVHEMEMENVFGGFMEGKISFPPTFKVTRGKAYSSYQTIRIPSYCDRILWHSLPLHKNHIRLNEYNSVTEIDTSDHKPVYAVFDLVIPKAVGMVPLPAPRDSIKCTLDFMKLRVHGLYEKKVEVDESNMTYEILEDGALGVTHVGDGNGQQESPSSHTRRLVHVDFHGGGLFMKEKAHRSEVPLKGGGRVRECNYEELPKIAMRPVRSLSDFTYKYVTVVFTRLGSKQGSSCVLPMANLVRQPGRHRYQGEMGLTKYGQTVARVEIDVELIMSFETWIDSRNNVVRPKR